MSHARNSSIQSIQDHSDSDQKSGAFKVPVRDYTIGSLLGLAPGILVTNLFAQQLENAIRNPGPGAIAILAALIVITALGAIWFKRKFATA